MNTPAVAVLIQTAPGCHIGAGLHVAVAVDLAGGWVADAPTVLSIGEEGTPAGYFPWHTHCAECRAELPEGQHRTVVLLPAPLDAVDPLAVVDAVLARAGEPS